MRGLGTRVQLNGDVAAGSTCRRTHSDSRAVVERERCVTNAIGISAA